MTRQRMALRLWERRMPIARMSARPTSPDKRLTRDVGPGEADRIGAWTCAPGTVGGA